METLTGRSEAQGRNGWFYIDRFSVQTPISDQQQVEQPIKVDFVAKRSGWRPPCSLHLTVEDARLLADAIHGALNPTSDTAWRPPDSFHACFECGGRIDQDEFPDWEVCQACQDAV